jgi:coatomer subunit delta
MATSSMPFSIHLKHEEKLSIRCGRDGGLESLEVHGIIMLRVRSEDYGRVLVAVENSESRNIQLQVRADRYNQ